MNRRAFSSITTTLERVLLPLAFARLILIPLVLGLFLLSVYHCTQRRRRKQRLQIHGSDFKVLHEDIRALEKIETVSAVEMGMNTKDFDSDTLRLQIKQKALSNRQYPSNLANLNKHHRLRQYRSRVNERALPVKLTPHRLPPGPPLSIDASRFWVVLIGIDAYPHNPLHGCVSDAQLMQEYFLKDLHVPPNRIQLLLGSQEQISPESPFYPSRAHITEMLLSLATNAEIQYGDNIVIFYAGHGSCYPIEKDGCAEPDYIEAICPIDRNPSRANGVPVPDISDREFNSILTQISRAKGRRITVILDCCHAGGVTREFSGPGARVIPVAKDDMLDMLVAGDSYLESYPAYQSIVSENWKPDMSSHVAIAACTSREFSKEKKVQREDGSVAYVGSFTDSLLRVLRSESFGKDTTYEDLVLFLDELDHQTPVVSGDQKKVRFWHQGPASSDSEVHPDVSMLDYRRLVVVCVVFMLIFISSIFSVL